MLYNNAIMKSICIEVGKNKWADKKLKNRTVNILLRRNNPKINMYAETVSRYFANFLSQLSNCNEWLEVVTEVGVI